MAPGILGFTPRYTVKPGDALRQWVAFVDELIADPMKRKKQPTLATTAVTHSTSPMIARVPPPSATPLVATRWREMTPMMAAVGPSTMPRQRKEQKSERMPTISAAIARPSVRGAAYPAAMGE